MTDKEGLALIGGRVEELIKNIDVQKKMVEIANEKGKVFAERYVYSLAIATLCGI